jgi:hypothetical protein
LVRRLDVVKRKIPTTARNQSLVIQPTAIDIKHVVTIKYNANCVLKQGG